MTRNLLLILSLTLLYLPTAAASTLVQVDKRGEISKKSSKRWTPDRSSLLPAMCESGDGEAVIVGRPQFDQSMVEYLKGKGISSTMDPMQNKFVLYKGKLLLACSNRVHILLLNADIQAEPDTMLYVYDNGGGTCAIMNLHDEHWNAVKIRVGKTHITLPPGRQLILTTWTNLNFDEVNLFYGTWFRRVYQFKPVPTINAFYTQYSLLSAAHVLPSVRKLANSNTREGNKLVKTAAAIYAASGYPKDFRWHISKLPEPKSASASGTAAAASSNAVASGTTGSTRASTIAATPASATITTTTAAAISSSSTIPQQKAMANTSSR